MNNFATINEVRLLVKALKALYENGLTRNFAVAKVITISMTSIQRPFDKIVTILCYANFYQELFVLQQITSYRNLNVCYLNCYSYVPYKILLCDFHFQMLIYLQLRLIVQIGVSKSSKSLKHIELVSSFDTHCSFRSIIPRGLWQFGDLY